MSSSPAELSAAVQTALARRDAQALRALTAPDAWVPGRGSVRLISENLPPADTIQLEGFGQAIEGDRAVLGFAVRAGSKHIGKIWFHAERVASGWALGGASRLPAQAGMFLRGELPARWNYEEAEPHAGAHDWAMDFLDDLKADRAPKDPLIAALLTPLARDLAGGIQSAMVGYNVYLPVFDLAVVQLNLVVGGLPVELLASLDIDGDAPRVLMITADPSLETLVFAGRTWSRDIRGEPAD